MKHTIFFAAGLLAAGCDQDGRRDAETEVAANRPAVSAPENPAATTIKTPVAPAQAPATAADDTDLNERDRSAAALTSGDQGGSEADRTVTQRVRQGVVDSDAISTASKNVKIITRDGVVTLRGPVKTPAEKAAILSIAQGVKGVKRVDNQLEALGN